MTELGKGINHFFEIQTQWFYDNGVFYINGRDIVYILIGINIGIVFVLLMLLVEYLEERWKCEHRR